MVIWKFGISLLLFCDYFSIIVMWSIIIMQLITKKKEKRTNKLVGIVWIS